MKITRGTTLFISLTLVLTLAAHFLGRTLSPNVQGLLLMWSPGLAALIASVIRRRPLRAIGWALKWKWMALGWALPVGYATLAYLAIWVLGMGDVPNPTFLERAQLTTGFRSENALAVILVAFLFITLVNLLPATVFALGEEIGWRGYLVPELARDNPFLATALISGALWTAWHLPGILSGGYGAGSTPLAFRLACFAAMVLSGAIILAWLRLRSGSIWPAAIFHATHNGVIQTFYERLTSANDLTAFVGGEFGLAVPVLSLAIAGWILWNHRSHRRHGISLAPLVGSSGSPRSQN